MNSPPTWSNPLRRLLRRSVRAALAFSPEPVRRAAARVPFSRYHALASGLFHGAEVIRWRRVRVKLDPGEVQGYYPYFFGDHCSPEIDQLVRLCGPGPAVVADVGANVGMVSLALARACPHAEVFAFEPDRHVAALFQENLALNPALRGRVRLVRQAAGDRDGAATFQPSSAVENNGIGRVVAGGAGHAGAYEVPVVRLDTFFARAGKDPALVKIDVEGHELAVLVEVHGVYHGADAASFNRRVRSRLEGAGYDLYALHGTDWRRCARVEEWPNRVHVFALRPGLTPAGVGRVNFQPARA